MNAISTARHPFILVNGTDTIRTTALCSATSGMDLYMIIFIMISIKVTSLPLSVGLPPCRGGEACVPLGS